MEALLVAGSILFWVYIGIMALCFLGAVSKESEVWSVAFVLAGMAGLQFLFSVNVIGFLPHTVGGWVALLGSYFVVGIAWSIYWFFVNYRKVLYRKIKEQEGYGGKWDSEEQRNEWIDKFAPRAKDMKASIIGRIADWPVSVIVYLLSDVMKDIGTAMYEVMGGFYEHIAASVRESVKRRLGNV
jgi:hypothetical protein